MLYITTFSFSFSLRFRLDSPSNGIWPWWAALLMVLAVALSVLSFLIINIHVQNDCYGSFKVSQILQTVTTPMYKGTSLAVLGKTIFYGLSVRHSVFMPCLPVSYVRNLFFKHAPGSDAPRMCLHVNLCMCNVCVRHTFDIFPLTTIS